ncbi:hypothetical protein ACK8P5_05255 [Paenibacillus sp. EC2-1]
MKRKIAVLLTTLSIVMLLAVPVSAEQTPSKPSFLCTHGAGGC